MLSDIIGIEGGGPPDCAENHYVYLYRELADEDVALAETGMSDYARLLDETDRYA